VVVGQARLVVAVPGMPDAVVLVLVLVVLVLVDVVAKPEVVVGVVGVVGGMAR
jgi:hypothetical protein